MKAIDRRAFLKGSFGTATTLTVLPQGRSSGAENKVVMGFMCLGRHGGGWQVFEGDPRVRRSNAVVSMPAKLKFGSIVDAHFDNFIDCIRTRKRPRADVEQAHISIVLCHLANISFRVGNRKLKFDGQTETIGDDAEAN